jgi:hypothetical protein
MKPELTQNEKNVIEYHRQHLRNKTYLKNPDGSVTTFMGTQFSIDENNPNGPTQLVPTYWNGKVLKTPREIYDAIKSSGINFPVYRSASEAARREKFLHDIMEKDIAMMQAKAKR